MFFLNMPTLGKQLKQAREARKLTIKQAVQGTRVRSYYIEAMEADDFSAMPSAAQARGFLRLYADFLGLNSDELIASLGTNSAPEADRTIKILPETTPPLPAPAPESVSQPQPLPVTPVPAPAAPVEPEPEAETLEPALPPGPPALSQTIFDELGTSLRERRELLSLTLDEIERHTHVRKHYLNYIENGAFDALPSPVQARGMLNAYAGFLDMNTEAVLLRFADALQARRIERQPPESAKPNLPRMRIGLPHWLRRFISADLIFGGSMVILLIGLTIWGTAHLLAGSSLAEATATEGPSISEVLLATPIGGESPTPEIAPTSVSELGTSIPAIDPALITPSETPTLILNFTPAAAVQITIIVSERTFLRVVVDGEIKQNGRVAPGSALTFDGNERIEVLTGSGAAVEILYNGQDLGIIGNLGEVVNLIYTRNGVETPTPTPSPLPTNTPRRQPSETPSPTLSPTVTPSIP